MYAELKKPNFTIALFSSAVITFVFLHQPFFWDNILIPAQVASFYFFNGFHPFQLPANFDCGHPPLLSYVYAKVWQAFGRSLAISHLLQWPFLFFTFYYFLKIGARFLSKNWLWAAYGLMLCDTTILAQSSQVGYEFPCVALLLYCIDYLLLVYTEDTKPNYFAVRRLMFYVALGLMPLIQLRGVGMVASIFLIEFIFRWHKKYSFKLVSFYMPYLTAANLLFCWLLLHLLGTGYLITNPNSSWGANNNGFVSWQMLPYNIAAAIWRLVDFGRAALWILLFVITLIALLKFKPSELERKKMVTLAYLLLVPLLVFSANFVLMNKSICHRYYLIVFLILPIALTFALQFLPSIKWRIALLSVSSACLLLGNLVVYPHPYSTGWDSTLAYLPYFSLRSDVKKYLSDEQIQTDSVYSCFPFSANESAIYLLPNEKNVAKTDCSDWEDEVDKTKPEFVLYSNLCSNFSTATVDSLSSRWPIRKQWQKGAVKIILYQRP